MNREVFETTLKQLYQKEFDVPEYLNQSFFSGEEYGKKVEHRSRRKGVVVAAAMILICFVLFATPINTLAQKISNYIFEEEQASNDNVTVANNCMVKAKTQSGYEVILEQLIYSEHEVSVIVTVKGKNIRKNLESNIVPTFMTKDGELDIFQKFYSGEITEYTEKKQKGYFSKENDTYSITVVYRGDQFLYEDKTLDLSVSLGISGQYEQIKLPVTFSSQYKYKEKQQKIAETDTENNKEKSVHIEKIYSTSSAILIEGERIRGEIVLVDENGEKLKEDGTIIETKEGKSLVAFQKNNQATGKYKIKLKKDGTYVDLGNKDNTINLD